MHSPILAPVVALVAWTLLMMIWIRHPLPGDAPQGHLAEGPGRQPGRRTLDGVVEDRSSGRRTITSI